MNTLINAHMKKGQLTIFMVFGVLILIVIGFLFLGKGRGFTQSEAKGTMSVENFIEQCIVQTTNYGLYQLGIHGGRIYDLDRQFSDGIYKIAYAAPLLDESKNDLQRYIDENLNAGEHSCMRNLRFFESEYDKIEVGPVKSSVEFFNETTIVTAQIPVVLHDKNTLKKYSKFSKTFNVRYKKILEFDQMLFAYKDRVPATLISQYDLNVYMLQYASQDEAIYIITDKKSKIGNDEYVFMSALKQTGKNLACDLGQKE